MPELLQDLITAAAAGRPEHPAARCRGRELSYRELDLRSDRLARRLAGAGVTRGDRVALYMHKSLECLIGLWGILKSGAAYVPLDVTSPPGRLAYVLSDCGIRVLVSEESKRDSLARIVEAGAAPRAVFGMRESPDGMAAIGVWDELELDDGTAAPVSPGALDGDDLCYVLYTSGSTGTPKGIMHTHASALAWAGTSTAAFGLNGDDRISNYAPLHFDLSTLDLFSTALVAGTMIMIPEEYPKLPASLAALLAEEAVTVFYTVPHALVQLQSKGGLQAHDWSALRWVLFGGEPISLRHLRALMAAWPGARFANVYGPTETNGCTYHILPAPPEDDEPLPIGVLNDGAEALILGEEGTAVAAGQAGELLIRAETLMKGYWNRPDLNARVFHEPGDGRGVFVRTGDIVRMGTDGQLRFLGRRDRLVKTRGYRVELDDVEAALNSHPGVEEAAAYTVADEHGGLLIHAAVTLETGDPGDATLGQHLRVSLPPYARPVSLKVVDVFPRTATGKIDRRKLQQDAQEEIDRV